MSAGSWRGTLFFLIILVVAASGAIRIMSTYSIFNQTHDEPAHIGSGMEWLDRGTYEMGEDHPPLARIAVALGPFLNGSRLTGSKTRWDEGNKILYEKGAYYWNLTLARLGTLPFFLLATIVVYMWSRQLFGKAAALMAIVFFTNLPPVLAHSGLATTDAAIMATLIAAVFAFTLWLAEPSVTRNVMLGVTVALAILSKFSAFVFLPSCILATMGLRLSARKKIVDSARPGKGKMLSGLGFAVLIAFCVIWAGYRFSFGSLAAGKSRPYERPYKTIDQLVGTEGILHDLSYAIAETHIPAPELVRGVEVVIRHNSRGHPCYLLGEVRQKGWWYFFPIALSVKTPLPFLLFTLVGYAIIVRQWFQQKRWQTLIPAVCPLALLMVCTQSNINIGVRHILPIYPFLAIVASFGATSLWNTVCGRLLSRTIVAVLVAWQLITPFLAHPDYLSYFNELAGRHPERILVDSDLDWGQDLQRLSKKLEMLDVRDVAVGYFGSTDITQHNMPVVRRLVPHQPTTGWIAISLNVLKFSDGFSWLEKYEPLALVGHSIRLYNLPEIKEQNPDQLLSNTSRIRPGGS